jgi:hypothetical protein
MCIRFARRKHNVALVAAMATGLAFATAAPAAHAQGMTIEGVWYVTTQQRNCTTYAAIGAPHRALVSFHAGGTLSDTSAVPSFVVGQRSEGHGTWRHRGGHEYTARWVAMLIFDTAAGTPPGSPGFSAGWQVATNTITMTGRDSFTSEGVSEFVSLSGQVYRTACASRVAERFE